PADTAEEVSDEERRPSANFPGRVEIVADDEGDPACLVVCEHGEPCEPEQRGLSVVKEYVPASGPDAGVTLVPPPARSLPWHLPRASEVLRYLEPGADDEVALFADVASEVKRHALLPTLRLHADAYYDLCAAWVLHTYYLEAAG